MLNLNRRSSRLAFLIALVAALIVWFAGAYALTSAFGAAGMVTSRSDPTVRLAMLIATLAMLIILLPITIRRLHDLGWTGWLVILLPVPVVNAGLAILLLLLPGQKRENDYGPSPIASVRYPLSVRRR